MKKWHSRAKITLSLGSKHLREWDEDRLTALCEEIRTKFAINKDDVRIMFAIKNAQTKILEFTAVCFDPSLDALSILKRLENKFLGLEIYSREVLYEENTR